MSNQYIHISEAVKKYDKTRQTFYNYLHKGLIRSKKINNRTYLHIWDIEELLSEYISADSGSEINEEVVEEIYDGLDSQKEDILSLHKKILNLEEQLSHTIYEYKKWTQDSVDTVKSMTKSFQYTLEWLLARVSGNQQKSRFLITITLLLLTHIIAWYLVL